MQIDDTLGYMLCRTARKVHRHIEKMFVPYDLTLEQWVAMKLLAENPNVSQRALAEQLEKDQNTVKAIVDRLIKKNYARREVNPSDRRAFLLCLTAEGNRIVEEMSVRDEQENLQLERALGTEETKKMRQMLRQLEAVIRDCKE